MLLEAGKKFTLVGIDIDTTGRRLLDEIVQLSAYHPKTQFSQYVMPYMNLNPAARQRHQLRVITIGFYRMLKCTRTNKILKSKSEIASLKSFLHWLDLLIKTESNSNGIILIYHEERKFLPYVLIEALKRYSLLERFFNIVQAFANGYEFAKTKCSDILKTYSLRKLSKVFLNKHQIKCFHNYRDCPKKRLNDRNQYFEGSACVRAQLAFELYQLLTLINQNSYEVGRKNSNDVNYEMINTLLEFNETANNEMLRCIVEIANPVVGYLNELEKEKKNLERQNSFRQVFLQYFEANLYQRVKAVKFRIILSESGYDYECLKTIWNEKRIEGLTEVIQKISLLKADEKIEIISLFDSHYDPKKQTIKIPTKQFRNRGQEKKNKGNLILRNIQFDDVKESQNCRINESNRNFKVSSKI